MRKNIHSFNIDWPILKRVASYINGATPCSLCLEEKLKIIKAERAK